MRRKQDRWPPDAASGSRQRKSKRAAMRSMIAANPSPVRSSKRIQNTRAQYSEECRYQYRIRSTLRKSPRGVVGDSNCQSDLKVSRGSRTMYSIRPGSARGENG